MRYPARAVLVVLVALLLGGASPRLNPTAVAQTRAAELAGIMGDVTCDGAVSIDDAVALSRVSAGIGSAPSCIAVAGDVTCDHTVDAIDQLRVMRAIAGFSEEATPPCVPTGDPIVRGPTSTELIDDALANEEITEDEAALYRVFSAYGAPGVPAELQGDDRWTTVSLDVAAVYANWDTLLPETRAALLPYMVPPISEDSWYTGDGSFTGRGISDLVAHIVPIIGTPGVKIWTRPDFPVAALANVTGLMTQLLTTSSTLMGRAPLDDSSVPAPNNGGDGALDIYVLKDLPLDAIAKWHNPNTCKGGPMFVEIAEGILPATPEQSSGGFAAAIQKVSHAFVHATAGGVNTPGTCVFGKEFFWAVEATSALTEHLAFPNLNTEHMWDDVFEEAHVSLHELPEGGESLWTMLAHMQRTDPAIVAELWQQAELSQSAHLALGAVNEIAETFPAYAVELGNSAPFDHFEGSLGLGFKLKANIGLQGTGIANVINVALNSQPMKEFNTALTALDDFSIQHYTFALTDPAVKSLSFSNLIHNVVGTSFQLLTKENPQAASVLTDITTKALHHICLADLGSSISELTLVMSHFDVDNLTPAQFADKPIVEARDSCGFTGTVSQTRMVTCIPQPQPCPEDIMVYSTFTASDLVFKRAETAAQDEEYYLLESGSLTMTVSGWTSENCFVTGTDSVDLLAGKGAIRIKNTETGINYVLYGYFGNFPNPTPQSEMEFQIDCGSGPSNFTQEAGMWMCSGGKQTSTNDSVLSGAYGLEYTEIEGFGCPLPSSEVVAFAGEDVPPGARGTGNTDRTWSWNLSR